MLLSTALNHVTLKPSHYKELQQNVSKKACYLS